jgi:hypothetical protein
VTDTADQATSAKGAKGCNQARVKLQNIAAQTAKDL